MEGWNMRKYFCNCFSYKKVFFEIEKYSFDQTTAVNSWRNIIFKNTGDKDVVFKKVGKPPVWMIF